MSQLFYNPAQHHLPTMPPGPAMPSHSHHNSRSRRGARFHSAANHSNPKAFKPSRATQEAAEAAQATAFRKDFEAARSFDLDDDEVFCPWHLLTEDDLQSIHSSSSDRSSSSDGSPDSSPMQHQIQPAPGFHLSASAQPHLPSLQHGHAGHLKLHHPMAQRQRNAIPIVDPNSRHTSPPNSISPARNAQKHYAGRRW